MVTDDGCSNQPDIWVWSQALHVCACIACAWLEGVGEQRHKETGIVDLHFLLWGHVRHCKVRADSDTFARLGAKQDRVAQAQCSAVQCSQGSWHGCREELFCGILV